MLDGLTQKTGRLPPLSPRPWRIGNEVPRDQMKAWLLHAAIETDEKIAADLAGPRYHINRSNLLVLESKADMQKRGQAAPDDGDALALTFAQPVSLAEVEEEDEEEEYGRYSGSSDSGWMR
jgi:hypothetical protein